MTPPPHPRPRVRWVGPTDGAEFGACHALALRDADPVDGGADLTVFASRRPTIEVGPIEEAKSNGAVVQLLGVWCEGEGRTGRTVPGVDRVFWHAWPRWWHRWLGAGTAAASFQGLVRVVTDDRNLAAAIVGALPAALWGRAAVSSPPAAIVWDGAQLGGREADRLAALCADARRTGSPVLALLDFPRPDTVAAAYALGAAAVLAKPFEYDALLDTLHAVIHGNRGTLAADDRPAPGVLRRAA